MEIEIEVYETDVGKRPFELWLKGLREIHTRAKIRMRLDRLRMGNFGDCKAIASGVSELKIHYGPGIRIYYGKIANRVVLLLCGGDKNIQERDITKAKEYLKEYKKRKENHGKK